MNEQQLIEFFDMATRAYCAACEKHPEPYNRVDEFSGKDLEFRLYSVRNLNMDLERCLIYPFQTILEEEVLEYIEEANKGDIDAQRRELLDCIAVLMREWERINAKPDAAGGAK